MGDVVEFPGVDKVESSLLVVFIPSVDRDSKPIDQTTWETSALEILGTCLGGATAFPRGRGVWRDDQQGGKLIYDHPIVIHSYTSLAVIKQTHPKLHAFLLRMGTETNQGAVGFVIDRTYMEIRFPLNQGGSKS